MKFALTSSSNYNTKNIVLLYSLLQNEIVPECVFIIKKPFIKGVRKQVSGLLKPKKHLANNPYLKKYMQEKNINAEATSLKKFCKLFGIRLVYVKSLNKGEFANIIRSEFIDIVINGGGGLFRKEAILSPKIGIVNTHMGELPRFRGMNVLEWSLFLKARIGVSLHFIDDGIDTGDIISFEEITVASDDTIESLRAKSTRVSINLIVNFILQTRLNEVTTEKQVFEDGKQYFVMHARLKNIVANNLSNSSNRHLSEIEKKNHEQ